MESIYNFVSRPGAKEVKEPLYRSKYDPKAPLTGSTFGLRGTRNTGKGIHEIKQNCVISSTFGPTDKEAPDPTNFLKRGSRATMPKSPTKHKCKVSQKSAVPSRDDKPVLGLSTCKNFVTHNAASAILSSPPKIKKDDDDFMQHEDYGKVPQYLARVKQEIAHEQNIIERHVKSQIASTSAETKEELVPMDETERKELIGALKERWDSINYNYQKICHRVAIENGDIKRKEAQEAQLQQLETDIEKLSRPGPVMIRTTTSSCTA